MSCDGPNQSNIGHCLSIRRGGTEPPINDHNCWRFITIHINQQISKFPDPWTIPGFQETMSNHVDLPPWIQFQLVNGFWVVYVNIFWIISNVFGEDWKSYIQSLWRKRIKIHWTRLWGEGRSYWETAINSVAFHIINIWNFRRRFSGPV